MAINTNGEINSSKGTAVLDGKVHYAAFINAGALLRSTVQSEVPAH